MQNEGAKVLVVLVLLAVVAWYVLTDDAPPVPETVKQPINPVNGVCGSIGSYQGVPICYGGYKKLATQLTDALGVTNSQDSDINGCPYVPITDPYVPPTAQQRANCAAWKATCKTVIKKVDMGGSPGGLINPSTGAFKPTLTPNYVNVPTIECHPAAIDNQRRGFRGN